jgi:hypothetical protein
MRLSYNKKNSLYLLSYNKKKIVYVMAPRERGKGGKAKLIIFSILLIKAIIKMQTPVHGQKERYEALLRMLSQPPPHQVCDLVLHLELHWRW